MAYRFPGRSQTASDGCLFFFISVKEFESPKSPERRFCISGNVISELRSLFLGNLTLFFDLGLFCCRTCEKATLKCGFFSCISIVNTGWHARRDSNPQPSEPESDALSITLLARTALVPPSVADYDIIAVPAKIVKSFFAVFQISFHFSPCAAIPSLLGMAAFQTMLENPRYRRFLFRKISCREGPGVVK